MKKQTFGFILLLVVGTIFFLESAAQSQVAAAKQGGDKKTQAQSGQQPPATSGKDTNGEAGQAQESTGEANWNIPSEWKQDAPADASDSKYTEKAEDKTESGDKMDTGSFGGNDSSKDQKPGDNSFGQSSQKRQEKDDKLGVHLPEVNGMKVVSPQTNIPTVGSPSVSSMMPQTPNVATSPGSKPMQVNIPKVTVSSGSIGGGSSNKSSGK